VPTRNVVITDRQAKLIEKLVAAGRYQNASEVLRDGLRLVESREADERARREEARAAIRVGIADAEAGRFRRFETAEDLRRHLMSLGDDAIAQGLARRRRR
jgi:antitoxin ParD1/3/4